MQIDAAFPKKEGALSSPVRALSSLPNGHRRPYMEISVGCVHNYYEAALPSYVDSVV